MKAEKDMLVFVPLGAAPLLEEVSWGIVKLVYESGDLFASVGKHKDSRGQDLPEEQIVKAAGVIPICKTDGKDATPQAAALKHGSEIDLAMLSRLFPQKQIPNQFAEIRVGALVVVHENASKDRPNPLWGIIQQIMPSGDLDVTIGKGYLFRNKILVKPGEIVPIIQTDGKSAKVKQVVAKHRSDIQLLMVLRLTKPP